MEKNQNNGSVHCARCESNPIKISVYKNRSSGNYFTAKFCETAINRIKPKNVYLDIDGNVCIEI